MANPALVLGILLDHVNKPGLLQDERPCRERPPQPPQLARVPRLKSICTGGLSKGEASTTKRADQKAEEGWTNSALNSMDLSCPRWRKNIYGKLIAI